MRVTIVLLLSLMLLQSQVRGNKTTISGTTGNSTIDKVQVNLMPFFNHCDSLFTMKNAEAHIIRAILTDLRLRLENVCGLEDMIKQVPVLVGGNLWNKGNLPHTIDLLLNYLKSDRPCTNIKGFIGIYIRSS